MLTLNLVGYHCPVPVYETRKALKNLKIGDVLLVVADDPETKHDIPALLARIGAKLLSVTENAGEFEFMIEKGGE